MLSAHDIAQFDEEMLHRWLTGLTPAMARQLEHDWPFWARPAQLPPAGDWRVWLVMAGRGFGKTRAGAEWVRAHAEADGGARIALVAATQSEARSVMVEGESGLLMLGDARGRPVWQPSRGRLLWPSGAQAFVYSAEAPESLRGAQHHYAWCDEIAKWAYPETCWDNLQFGLRLGRAPRALVTTTPRPIALIRALLADQDVVVTRGRSRENRFLSPAFLAAVERAYGGTQLGRQELDGELIDEVVGALWSRTTIERCRRPHTGPWRRVVVGVDPPAGIGRDACGIVVVARDEQHVAAVVEDASVSGLPPEGWAAAVTSAALRHGADRIVAEANNGGAMVASVLRAAGPALPIKLVHASRGKVARAEPVAALYGAGRVIHAGTFPDLEDELCGLIMGGDYAGPGNSPDRADALVWALTELMLGPQALDAAPTVRAL